MTKKFLALTMVLVLVAGVGALAAQQYDPLSSELTLGGIVMTSPFLGDYDEAGSTYGISGRITLANALTFRGSYSRSSTRTSEYYWVTFKQHDEVLEGMLAAEIDLYGDCRSALEISLRPGFVFGNKVINTRIEDRWMSQTHYESRSRGFSGWGLELGIEGRSLAGYVGIQNIYHKTCCEDDRSWKNYLGISYKF